MERMIQRCERIQFNRIGFVAIYLLAASCLSQSFAQPTHRGPDLAHKIPQAERAALMAIYKATDGDRWKNHNGWLGDEGTECSWYGVTCGFQIEEPTGVRSLHLGENNLRGVIPEEAAQLKNLEWLDVSGNNLSGMISPALVSRWLSGKLEISAEPTLLTDVSEIDYEYSPSSLLCGSHRLILRSDGTAISFSKKCRNRTSSDRSTFCEVKEGRTYQFALLGRLLEREDFFTLASNYELNVTDSVFESTRVTRNGKRHEVVVYAGGAPFAEWVVATSIQGVAASAGWRKTTTRAECPRWDDAGALLK